LSCRYSILIELEFRKLVFEEGGKPENPEKNPQSKARINNRLNPHMTAGPESNSGYIGGG